MEGSPTPSQAETNTCNACHQTIAGKHYKCGTCPCFELCEACEKKTPHDPSHNFVQVKVCEPTAIAPKPKPRPTFNVGMRNDGPKNIGPAPRRLGCAARLVRNIRILILHDAGEDTISCTDDMNIEAVIVKIKALNFANADKIDLATLQQRRVYEGTLKEGEARKPVPFSAQSLMERLFSLNLGPSFSLAFDFKGL